jgi:hypothetical protein
MPRFTPHRSQLASPKIEEALDRRRLPKLSSTGWPYPGYRCASSPRPRDWRRSGSTACAAFSVRRGGPRSWRLNDQR